MSLYKDRPSSAFRSTASFIGIKSNNTSLINLKTQSPSPILTRPNSNSKKLKLKGMGNKFEKEELYQLNQQLKSTINILKAELYEAKSRINKKEREIKKKKE